MKNILTLQLIFGEMAEWSNAAVLKTVVPQGTGGSNPSFSATLKKAPTKVGAFVFEALWGGACSFPINPEIQNPCEAMTF